MELPSVKLNIFKKLEYFQVLKELNKQFDTQFRLLISRKWKADKGRYNANYPTWEIEKKILFWSYIYHKHLKSWITRGHLKDMRVSREERLGAGGIEKIFANLEMRGFGKMKYIHDNKRKKDSAFVFNERGLSFGELLWYLYKIKEHNKTNSGEEPKKYFGVYKTNYQLSRKSLGYLILQGQVFSLSLFMIYIAGVLTFEVLDKVGLLDDLKSLFLSWKMFSQFKHLLSHIIILPFVIFLVSFIADFVYKFFGVYKKYRTIEK